MKTKINTGIALLCALVAIIFFSSLKTENAKDGDITGAWHYGTPDNHTVMITSPTAFAVSTYDLPGKKLTATYGGTWRMEGSDMIRKIEWHSVNPDEVGKETKYAVQLSGNKLKINPANETYTRLDAGKPGALAGAWIITGNYSNDTLQKWPVVFQSRRTIKILSGTRFQWIAYDIDSKKMMNTGGGTYTTANGKYTENIEFFTKSAEGVGKTLTFNYAFDKDAWRHSGLSSAGKPVDEHWVKRETLEK